MVHVDSQQTGIVTNDDGEELWQPGQHLPTNPPQNYIDEAAGGGSMSPSDVYALIVEMKTSLEASINDKFNGVQSTLKQLSTRVEKLEDYPVTLSSTGENTSASGGTNSSGSMSDETTPKRKRRVPVDVAVSLNVS